MLNSVWSFVETKIIEERNKAPNTDRVWSFLLQQIMVEIKSSSKKRDPTSEQLGLVSYERIQSDLDLLASELSSNHASLPSVAEYVAKTANNGGVHIVDMYDQDMHNPTVNLMTVFAGMVLHIRGDFDRVNLFVPDIPSNDEHKTYQAITEVNGLNRVTGSQFTVVCSDADNFTDAYRQQRVENMYHRLFQTASDNHKIAVLPIWVPNESSQVSSPIAVSV